MSTLASATTAAVQDGFAAWVILFAPLCAAVIVACVPAVRKRPLVAATISIAAIGLGSAIAPPLLSFVMVRWGWRTALLVSAVPALAVAAA